MNVFSELNQPRREAKASTRATVLRSATDLLLTAGPSVTVREIADAAGVSVGTVMNVADKDGLIVLVVDAVLVDLSTGTVDTSADAMETVLRPPRGFVEWFARHSDLARAYLSILVAANHRSDVFGSLAVQFVRDVSTALGGTLAADDKARLIHRAYLGQLMIWAGSGDTDPARTLEELEHSVRCVVGAGS